MTMHRLLGHLRVGRLTDARAWRRGRTVWPVAVFAAAALGLASPGPLAAFGGATGPTTPTVTGGSAAWSSATARTIAASGSVEQCRHGRCPALAGYQDRISANGGTSWTAPVAGAAVTVSAEGTTRVQFRAIDTSGNVSSWAPSSGSAGTVNLDRTPPSVPTVSGGSATATANPVTVTGGGATDPCSVNACSGVSGYLYRVSSDGGTTWSTPTAGSSVTISTAGTSFVEFAAVDAAGNTSAWSALSTNGEANLTTTTTTPPPLGISGAWTLTFADEFNETSLDTTRFTTGWFGSGITPPVNSAEQDCYDPAQVSVGSGALDLTAIAKSCAVSGKTFPYRTGIVTTFNTFTYTYGVLEARIYLPGSSGTIDNWPAFWADGTGTWPTTGENDVMEGLGGSAAYHFHSPSGSPGADVPGNFTGWHTYAADWEPGVVTYYYDGTKVGQITTGITAAPMYIILDYAVSSAVGGPTSVPQTMKVDYVRVWHQSP
jgi:beta-glucanase (GH16 family)